MSHGAVDASPWGPEQQAPKTFAEYQSMRKAVLKSDQGTKALMEVLRHKMEAACAVLETESMWLHSNEVVRTVADLEHFSYRFERPVGQQFLCFGCGRGIRSSVVFHCF